MLHERLAALRMRAGLSQRELDLIAGLAVGHCWLLENGHRLTKPRVGVSLSTIQRLATALGSSVGYLANGEGEPPSDEDVAAAVAAGRERLAAQKAAG